MGLDKLRTLGCFRAPAIAGTAEGLVLVATSRHLVAKIPASGLRIPACCTRLHAALRLPIASGSAAAADVLQPSGGSGLFLDEGILVGRTCIGRNNSNQPRLRWKCGVVT